MDLTDAERSLLDFEREWWLLPTSKMSEIRTRFGFSASSYYRMLHQLVARPAAEAYDPLTVRRVRRPHGPNDPSGRSGEPSRTPCRCRSARGT